MKGHLEITGRRNWLMFMRFWQGVTVDLHNGVEPFHLEVPALDHHLVMYTPWCGSHGTAPSGATARERHPHRPRHGYAGRAGVHLARDRNATIRMRMPTYLLGMAAEELGTKPERGAELRNVFHTRAMVIGHLSAIFADELDWPSHPTPSLLIQPASLSLAQVALITGFADQSHFSRRFRLQFECAPSSYAGDRRP